MPQSVRPAEAAPARATPASGARRRSRRLRLLAVIGLAIGAVAITAAPAGAASPSMVLTPNTGPSGTIVTVRGSNLPPRSRVQILWSGQFKGFPTAAVDRYGRFSVGIRVPSGWNARYHVVAASVRDPSRTVVTSGRQLAKWLVGAHFTLTGSPALTGMYGSAIGTDSKANIALGRSGSVSHRFVASTSSQVRSIRWPQRFGPGGYSGGNGGTIRITIQPDANGVPSGQVLAATTYRPTAADMALNASRYYGQAFTTSPSLVRGRVYHVVFENIDRAPSTNWLSINEIFVYSATSPRQPGLPETFAVLRKEIGEGWRVASHYTPVFDLAYSNGAHDGQGYVEPMFNHYAVVDGAHMARERFTPRANRRVVEVHVRVKRHAGTKPLILRVERGGAVLASVTLTRAATIAASSLPSIDTLAGAQWVGGKLNVPVNFVAGQTYDLRLSTAAGTRYTVVPVRAGTDGGGTGNSYALLSRTFRDGVGQKSSDGGRTWRKLYEWSPQNLPFYFR